jgi:hypothetical protein
LRLPDGHTVNPKEIISLRVDRLPLKSRKEYL